MRLELEAGSAWASARSIKSLRRNMLGFVGVKPVGDTLIGMTGKLKPRCRVNPIRAVMPPRTVSVRPRSKAIVPRTM